MCLEIDKSDHVHSTKKIILKHFHYYVQQITWRQTMKWIVFYLFFTIKWIVFYIFFFYIRTSFYNLSSPYFDLILT